MKIQNNTFIADEGKVIRCKCHGVILGTEVYLRKIIKNGKLEDDTPDNYEEIDEPVMEEENYA